MSYRDVAVWDLGDGLFVDEDGEIIGGDDDGGALARLCAQIAHWQEQVQGYERAIGAAKAAVLKRQADKRAVHGEWVASIRQNVRRDLNRDAFRADLEERRRSGDLPFPVATALALAATGFDRGALPDDVRDMVERHIEEKPTKPYLMLAPVMKSAPVPLMVPRGQEVAS